MFVLVQIYPPEAAGDDDETPLDVIAVDASEAELERYLAAYEYRFRAACEDFDAWDSDLAKDWATNMTACTTSSWTGTRSTAA